MSIASPSETDYTTCITTLRGHLAKGTAPSAYEQRLILAVLKDSVSRQDDANTAIAAVVADIEVLDAAACSANAGADAAAVIVTAVSDLEAAAVTVPSYATSVVDDG